MNNTGAGKRVDLTGFPVNDSPTPVNWRGKVFHVWPLIDPAEAISLVNDIMDACYDHEHQSMVPEMSDFIFKERVIMSYSDILLPEDAKECYRLLYLTDLYETVVKHASKQQIESVRRAVDMMLYHIE